MIASAPEARAANGIRGATAARLAQSSREVLLVGSFHALLSAMKGLVIPLRLNEGFSKDAYVEPTEAFRNCAQAWAGQDCFHGWGERAGRLESLSYAYPEPAAGQIMNAAFEIHGLVQECVGIDWLHYDGVLEQKNSEGFG